MILKLGNFEINIYFFLKTNKMMASSLHLIDISTNRFQIRNPHLKKTYNEKIKTLFFLDANKTNFYRLCTLPRSGKI